MGVLIFTTGEYQEHGFIKVGEKKSDIHTFDLAGRTLENPYVCGHLQ